MALFFFSEFNFYLSAMNHLKKNEKEQKNAQTWGD